MTVAELLLRVINDPGVRVQHFSECLLGAQSRKRGATEIRFLTTNITPSDLATGEPPYVGMVLWIPREVYAAAEADDAVDPSAAEPGTPSPREASS